MDILTAMNAVWIAVVRLTLRPERGSIIAWQQKQRHNRRFFHVYAQNTNNCRKNCVNNYINLEMNHVKRATICGFFKIFVRTDCIHVMILIIDGNFLYKDHIWTTDQMTPLTTIRTSAKITCSHTYPYKQNHKKQVNARTTINACTDSSFVALIIISIHLQTSCI